MKKTLNYLLLLAILGVAVLFYVLNPEEHELFPKCMFHSLTGAYCPGCGSQRAIHALVHLNFAGVINYNFLFLPAALLFVYHYLHPHLNRILGWKLPNLFYLKYTPWIILAVVVLFWILRNLPWHPFSALAPG